MCHHVSWQMGAFRGSIGTPVYLALEGPFTSVGALVPCKLKARGALVSAPKGACPSTKWLF